MPRHSEPLEQGTVTHKGPCSHCGSSDARAHYDNGTSYCFSGNCREEDKWQRDEEQEERPRNRRTPATDIETETFEFEKGEVTAIEKRGLSQETCKKWRYEVNADKGCHIANFFNEDGELVAQKLRKAGKKFSSVGPERKNKPLYGMWLWGKGRRIVVTEGEIDALSMSEAFDNKWPVVSLPDGADSAEKAFKQHYEYLCGFDVVVLMFDEDKPGRVAAEAAAAILPPGKAHIAKLPAGCKDPNEVLLKHGKAALVRAQWDAKEWRPDGIVSGKEFTRERLKKAVVKGYTMRLPGLQEKMLGIRKREITLFTAGSGVGKSTTARQLEYELHQDFPELKFANVYLEEPNEETAQAFVALHTRVPKSKLRFDPDVITDAQWDDALEKVVHQRMWFYNHFGSLESTNLLTKLRYFATVCEVDFIVLDHISIVTSGVESSSEGERKDIDILMTRLSSLTQETGVGIIAIAHLKRAQGKTFTEGDQVSLSDLRGSASLEQLSHNVIAAERDQQADDDTDKDTVRYRILKCREVGDLGLADTVVYNRQTGWLEPIQVIGL
jgi:twinkle protein